jgi:beta-lactamase class A
MSWFRDDPRLASLGETLVEATLQRFSNKGLTPESLALTLLLHPEPLDVREPSIPAGFSYHGSQPFYPCSVVKVFYLVAAQQRLEEGFIAPHEDLTRAMRDMIRVSSNAATNYVIDLVTGTTGDTLLGPAEISAWRDRRNWANRYLKGFGWAEFEAINVCQKLMDDDRYGREKVFVGAAGANHNRLTTDATARLFHAIMTGRVITAERAGIVRNLMRRPLDADFIRDEPAGQVLGYFGAGLPPGARLWSKAGSTGWTGDLAASFRRHDAAYVELPNGRQFTLVLFSQGREISADQEFLPAVASLTCELVSS